MHQQSLSTEVACRATVATLERKITELAAHISAAEYQFLSLLAEFDSQHGWSGVGIKSCAHWLNWKCGIGLGAAREKVRVATALMALPNISEAFRNGRLSYSKVRAMTRVATPENEEALLSVANQGTASHVERLVRSYRKVNRLEALAIDNERHGQRSLSWTRDESGCYIIKARLSPEQGARITRVINRVVNSDLVNIDGEKKAFPRERLLVNDEPMRSSASSKAMPTRIPPTQLIVKLPSIFIPTSLPSEPTRLAANPL